ncbi:MAG: PDZ domain-containing protein [Vicinamibacterales bacterium]
MTHSARSTGARVLATATAALLLLVANGLLRPHWMSAAQPAATPAATGAPIEYRLSFPEAEQRLMSVDVTFRDIGTAPLEIRMSRSSPGRYALHEFAKNVFDVRATDGAGRALVPTRPNPHQWDVGGHDGTVRVSYRVFGDRTDGTYLSVNDAHAHINAPAALMWARGTADRPARITFDTPPGRAWKVATQLLPTDDPRVFTAPNLQYLMDSPVELGTFRWLTFELPVSAAPGPPGGRSASFRIALHDEGTPEEAEAFRAAVERIVREERAVYGELAPYDGGTYTFLCDYLPWASGDGMEHRNSTVLSATQSLANGRDQILGTVAHEFFHSWNVERIRPRSLEPFDFEEANMSGELWLAEGVTSYYDSLVTARTGIDSLESTLATWGGFVNAVTLSPGRRFRSAEDMSRLAPFVDAARSVDPTNWSNTFISYYTYGAALGLALDLSLRDETAGRVTLDDFMRAMWETHGRPGGPAPGLVANPYTAADAQARLAAVSGNARFANDFFDRYVRGHEVVDYRRLFARAGFTLRPRHPGQAWMGLASLESRADGLVLQGPTPFDSPAFAAGLAQGDVIQQVEGRPMTAADALTTVLASRRPGDTVTVQHARRGRVVSTKVTLAEDPRLELVANEAAGLPLDDAQRTFRRSWLESKVR